MRDANLGNSAVTLGNAEAGAGQHDVEVHAEDTSLRIVLQAEIDVLSNAETEVAGGGEVRSIQLVLLHLQRAVENLSSLRTTDGGVDSDLLVTTNAEAAHGVTGYKKNNTQINYQ